MSELSLPEIDKKITIIKNKLLNCNDKGCVNNESKQQLEGELTDLETLKKEKLKQATGVDSEVTETSPSPPSEPPVTTGGKKSKRTTKKRKGNDWTRLVTKTFKDNKKKNKNYTFKQAILDAKKVYKKKGGESDNNNNNNNNQNQNNNQNNNQDFSENNNNNQNGGKKSRKNKKNKTKKGGQENNQNQNQSE